MTTYNHANFHGDVLPTRLTHEAKQTIRYAIAQGWTLTIRRDVCTLTAPTGSKRITLGPRSQNENYNAIVRTIDKYASPFAQPLEDVISDPEKVNRKAKNITTAEQMAKAREEAHAVKTLVKEGPMISKGGSLGGYTSDIATQREYSDGSMEYACIRCGFVSSTPRGAGSHWGKHVREDERNRGGHKGVEVPVQRPDYQPTEERLASLAEAIAAALKEGIDWTDPKEAARQLALTALTWDHDRRVDAEPGIREPLSDTEVLNRIRGLVDNGLYETQNNQINEMAAELETLRVEYTQTQQELISLHREVDAAAELFSTLKERKA